MIQLGALDTLILSNDTYDVYVSKKVFIGYVLKKFMKGKVVDLIEKIDINKDLSKRELEMAARSLLEN